MAEGTCVLGLHNERELLLSCSRSSRDRAPCEESGGSEYGEDLHCWLEVESELNDEKRRNEVVEHPSKAHATVFIARWCGVPFGPADLLHA